MLVFPLILFIPWTISTIFATKEPEYKDLNLPLFMVYYHDIRVYAFWGKKDILERLQYHHRRFNLPFRRVVLLCLKQNKENRKDVLYVKYVIRTSFPAWTSMNCVGHFFPSVVENRIGNGFSSGYYVEDDNKTLQVFKLYDFPTEAEEFEIFDDTESSKEYPYTYFPFWQKENEKTYRIHILWISWDKTTIATLQTIHRFVSHYCPKEESKYRTSCNGYVIGRNQLDGIKNFNSMEYYYSPQNQNTVLMDTARPRSPKDPSSDEFFYATPLTPLDDFCDDDVKRAACTYLNTVPIWESISRGPIRAIELFIQEVAQKLYINTLQVRTVAYDILKLQLKDSPVKREIYLDSKYNRIPVPRIFMKIIDYRIQFPILPMHHSSAIEKESNPNEQREQTKPDLIHENTDLPLPGDQVEQDRDDSISQSLPQCDQTEPDCKNVPQSSTQRDRSDEDSQHLSHDHPKYDHYYVALVIHNELPQGEKICGDSKLDLCKMLGWKLPLDADITDAIYCCTLDDPKLKQTRLSLPETQKPLNLNKVPALINQHGQIIEFTQIIID